MKAVIAVIAVILIGAAHAGQKCTGSPRKYNGKNCASTTHYADYHKGACGCGPDNGDSQVSWNHKHFVAAANQLLFDAGHKGWCGQNCGRCVRLTTTDVNSDQLRPEGDVQSGSSDKGLHCLPNILVSVDYRGGYVEGQGGSAPEGQSHVFMISNLCPNVWPNLSWCNQVTGRNNQYGYGWHFDLENGAGQVTGMGWNNPEVTWEFTNCDGHGSETPTNHNYHSDCFCGKHGKK